MLDAPATKQRGYFEPAFVSRLLRDKATRDKLRGTDNAEALYAILTESKEERAA